MNILLVRHGQSQANTGKVNTHEMMGDAYVPLTEEGIKQSKKLGLSIGKEHLNNSLIYCSPYSRTRMTLGAMLQSASVNEHEITRYEDPRLREEERGYSEPAEQMGNRSKHGWFYYRHHGGESSADVYDRVSGFLESLMRQVNRSKQQNVLIVTHGAVIRAFVMRFMHLTVEQFESLSNPNNASAIKIGLKGTLDSPVISNARWEVEGITCRDDEWAGFMSEIDMENIDNEILGSIVESRRGQLEISKNVDDIENTIDRAAGLACDMPQELREEIENSCMDNNHIELNDEI